MCNVPASVIGWIENNLAENHYYLRGGSGLDREGREIQRWLDTLPQAPEPDWSRFDNYQDDEGYYGPDCFVMSPWGNTLHYFRADDIEQWWGRLPDMDEVYNKSFLVVDIDESKMLGIDWRTTLRKRPE